MNETRTTEQIIADLVEVGRRLLSAQKAKDSAERLFENSSREADKIADRYREIQSELLVAIRRASGFNTIKGES